MQIRLTTFFCFLFTRTTVCYSLKLKQQKDSWRNHKLWLRRERLSGMSTKNTKKCKYKMELRQLRRIRKIFYKREVTLKRIFRSRVRLECKVSEKFGFIAEFLFWRSWGLDSLDFIRFVCHFNGGEFQVILTIVRKLW